MRGEYPKPHGISSKIKELPPRARRIPWSLGHNPICIGTTSACAENTHSGLKQSNSPRNYLRVRGEYSIIFATLKDPKELPPRARRILSGLASVDTPTGTTSACAENTRLFRSAGGYQRNYLRVRGEYSRDSSDFTPWQELPPRARRIRISAELFGHAVGTTSACAENTLNELGLL